jgi:hypothetical protein
MSELSQLTGAEADGPWRMRSNRFAVEAKYAAKQAGEQIATPVAN